MAPAAVSAGALCYGRRAPTALTLFGGISAYLARSGPVRGGPVIVVNLCGPSLIGHRWPVVLVESRRLFEAVRIHVQDEGVILGIEFKRLPRNGKQFIAHAEESAERQHAVSDASA